MISVSPAAKPAPATAPAGHVITARRPDHQSGTAGPDVIYGGAGNDTLTGGLGRDHIDGGRGNDTIFARDGQRDVIDWARVAMASTPTGMASTRRTAKPSTAPDPLRNLRRSKNWT